MDIKIGITNSPREIAFETAQTADEIEKAVAAALDDKATHLSLQDDKGRRFIVPVASLAYVEVGAEESRRIGFVA
ncbi:MULTISPECIES: DUF3107 domain-containing protein [unclassified Curtobacterium]|uniref:DUF3107 domain-containing protein n=1 Tax=unclassified Curtobacterium TaxID=257496 RepID=UPI00089E047C|nr:MULTISPECIES: DUF3107 domain-containing protein [unclassified Curtobacterium]AOX67494.1 ATP-binding protein [Curtobacterium sp. BH-2-1-1]MCC8906948.1 DUF3107 domain-containing protein [Curtobacterium sp. GD1]MCT9620901.1 DUF3107 domain-containing protein [Curtobacterium sp. C2H10]MDR6574093.1 hypothetical protein [Curtobacterium sp. 320]OII24392.1 ATP-binding protein [Curtobacterium sp. MCBA15_016]